MVHPSSAALSRRLAVALVCLLALALGARGAGAQPAGPRVIVSGVEVDAGTLAASVTVIGPDGLPASGLTPGAFAATVDGQPVPVTAAASSRDEALGLAVVLAVDTSGSMQGASIDAAKSAVAAFVQALQPKDRAELLTFANSVQVAAPFTADHAALEAAAAKLTAAGNTALYAAVAQAASVAAGAPEPRKAVVLLSDGEDFGNASAGVTREAALAAAQASGAPFFVVGLGAETDSAFLASLAGARGEHFAAGGAGDLGKLYGQIADRLLNQYTVRMTLPAALAPGDHTLAITVAGASAQATFTTNAAAGAQPALAGLLGDLRTATTVRLTNVPTLTTARFELDGAPLPAEADGRSVLLDPMTLDPATVHHLEAGFDPVAGQSSVAQDFRVAALAPVLAAPDSLAGARAGDLVRVQVTAQPGPITVTATLDGTEVARLERPPFEFLLPKSLASGNHQLQITARGAGGEARRDLGFDIPGGGGTPAGAYLVLAAALVVVAAIAGYGLWRALRRVRLRRPAAPAPPAEKLEGWTSARAPAASAPAAPVPLPAEAWGELEVLSGRDAGRRFPLTGDRELIGSGKTCTIRLRDRSLAEAHFVVAPDGTLLPSTPACRVVVDGAEIRRAVIADTAVVEAGATRLRITLGAHGGEPPARDESAVAT